MTRQTVIHLIATNFYGGPEKQILTHARHLDPERFRFILVSFVEKGQPNEILEKASQVGLEHVGIPVGHAFDPGAILGLKRLFRQYRADLVCSHGYKANILGRLSTWAGGIPQIAVSRGWTAENRRIRLYEVLDKIFLHLNDHVVAVSHGQGDKILRLGLRHGRLSVIHNAISLDQNRASGLRGPTVKEELGIPAHALLVASAGRLSPEKNYRAMIEAAVVTCSRREDVFFAVFGEGFLRAELEGTIKVLGLEGRFLLPGFRRDMPQVMEQIDVFMLPSFTEGLPNVILEAFAAKKPVVATRVGGTPEVVQDGVSGFLTEPDEPALMAGHVLALAGDPALRSRMGGAGYQHVLDEFGFERQTRLYEELYVKVAK